MASKNRITVRGLSLVFAPEVHVIARQAIDPEGLASLLAVEGGVGWETDTGIAAQQAVEVGGRICYRSFANPRPGGNKAYIDHILAVNHGSVLEHAVWTLAITGVSRTLTHELVRHRVGISFSQESQRYVDASEAAFVVPPIYEEFVREAVKYCDGLSQKLFPSVGILYEHAGDRLADNAEAGLHWMASVERARDCYEGAYRRLDDMPLPRGLTGTAGVKAVREAARSLLPGATETRIQITANARTLRHFIGLRGSAGADAEMRRLCRVLLPVLQREAPHLFGDLSVEEEGSLN